MKIRRFFIAGLAALVVALVPGTASAAVAPPSAASNTLLITASIPSPDPGFTLIVQFRCSPGTVTGPGPDDFTLTGTADPFDTTGITGAAPTVGAPPVTPNICTNNVTAARTQIDVTTDGSDAVDSVLPGGGTVLSDITQNAAIPSSVFLTGYRLEFLNLGSNTISINASTKIEGTDTVEGTQPTNVDGGSPPDATEQVTTVISDPTPATRGDGDETATPGEFTVEYDDLTWTADPAGTILYRQASIVPVPVPPDSNGNPQPKPKKKCKKGFKKKKIKGKVKCVKKKNKKKKKK